MSDDDINVIITSKVAKTAILTIGDEAFIIVNGERRKIIDYVNDLGETHKIVDIIKSKGFDFSVKAEILQQELVTRFTVTINKNNKVYAVGVSDKLAKSLCIAIIELTK